MMIRGERDRHDRRSRSMQWNDGYHENTLLAFTNNIPQKRWRHPS